MKRISTLLLLLFFFCSVRLSGQFLKPNEVPPIPKAVLDSVFPGAKFPLWKTIDENNYLPQKYQATFTYDGKRTWVMIDSLGSLFLIEKSIEKDSLPLPVSNYLSGNYKYKHFIEGREIYLSDSNFILIVVKGYNIYHTILFSEDGKFISSKSSAAGFIISVFAATFIIRDVGIFKPFKIKDGLMGPRRFNFSSEKK